MARRLKLLSTGQPQTKPGIRELQERGAVGSTPTFPELPEVQTQGESHLPGDPEAIGPHHKSEYIAETSTPTEDMWENGQALYREKNEGQRPVYWWSAASGDSHEDEVLVGHQVLNCCDRRVITAQVTLTCGRSPAPPR